MSDRNKLRLDTPESVLETLQDIAFIRYETHYSNNRQYCDSPIEAMVYCLIRVFWENMGLLVEPTGNDDGSYIVIHSEKKVTFVVTPQKEVGPYRLDLEIVTRTRDLEKKFAIECDGADWHHGTWDQVKRDRERDQYLADAAYEVLRFPGKQIHRDSATVLNQIVNAITLEWKA